jgi:hypothetical protein
MPAGKTLKIGVWENDKYIGAVIFSRGASYNLLNPFGLKQNEGCELTRVALTKHITPVSKIVSVSIRLLKKKCPKLQMVISFADPVQNHHGGIYQAGNWIYSGRSNSDWSIKKNNKVYHRRSIFSKYKTTSIDKLGGNFEKVKTPGKHRYLMPLNKNIRKKVIKLSKPYPKRMKLGDGSDQENSEGSTPIHALQDS